MKEATHTFTTTHGEVTVKVDIFKMDLIEAVEVYNQNPCFFGTGGYRVVGVVNGVPRGTHFYGHGDVAAKYFGQDTEAAARSFLAEAHQSGFLS